MLKTYHSVKSLNIKIKNGILYCTYTIFTVSMIMVFKHITNHKSVVFSLYRSKLRVANLMGYKYGTASSRFIQDLSLCDHYIRSGKLIDYQNQHSLLIGNTIRMHYKMTMYSVTASSNIFIDRALCWLRVLNS